MLWSWDGGQFVERELAPGLHVVVNSGLASDLWPVPAGGGYAEAAPDTGPGGLTAEQAAAARAHELGRIGHFLPRLRGGPDAAPGARGPGRGGVGGLAAPAERRRLRPTISGR